MTATGSGYIAISRRPLDLEDYIDVTRRHIAWVVGPLFAGLVVSIVVAFMLPNSYRSEAVMQITPAAISEELVKSTGNQLLTDRILQMEGDILSRSSLSSIITEMNLYPAERAKEPIEDIIETMKSRDLRIDVTNVASVGKHGSAFKIVYSYTNRVKAQQTVVKLITRFMDANQSAQRDQMVLVHSLIGDEFAQAKTEMDKTSEELTKFKMANQGRLPEQAQINIANLTSLQNQVYSIQDQLNRLAQERLQQEAHLSTLKSQLDLFGVMAQDNPASAAGSPAMRQNMELEQLTRQIDAGETRLQQLLLSFKETYPDVRDLKKNLSVLKKQRDDLEGKISDLIAAETARPKEAPRKTTNYQVAQRQTELQGMIDSTNTTIKNIDSEKAYRLKDQEKYTRQIEEYRNKLAATSGIEARYTDLLRDQANATQKYQTMVGKQELTAQNTEMINRKAGEKLEVLDNASLPLNPFSPPRFMIVGGGVAASFLLGLALAGVQEARDSSLKNLKDVRAYTNLPVLCSIPLLENTLLVKRKKRVTYLAWSAAVIVGIIAVSSAMFYYYSVTLPS